MLRPQVAQFLLNRLYNCGPKGKSAAKATKAKETAEAGKRTLQLVAGGAGAAGLAGAGLAYGAGRKQERQRQARRYA